MTSKSKSNNDLHQEHNDPVYQVNICFTEIFA